MANFNIPNSADALLYPQQAAPDSGDFTILTGGTQRTGVVSGCVVSAAATGSDRSILVTNGTVVINGTQVVVPRQVIASGSVATDLSLPRFSLVTIDTSGIAAIVPGTPAATPAFPTFSSSVAVLASVWLPAGAPSITDTNITSKSLPIHNPVFHEQEWTRGLGLFPATVPVRKSWAAMGAPGSVGKFISAAQSYTILDTSATATGGVASPVDYRSAPGVVHAINIYLKQITNYWPWIEECGVEIYYDGQTVPTIRMPFRNWMGVAQESLNAGYIVVERSKYVNWMSWCSGAVRECSFSFKVPIPFNTSIKVVLTTPNTDSGQAWALCDYTLGSNLGFGTAKLRSQWWSQGATSAAGYSCSTLADVGRVDSGGRYSPPTAYGTQAAPNGSLAPGAVLDTGWGTRIWTTGGATISAGLTTIDVFNASALIRGMPVGTTDPRTGTTINNNTGPTGPGGVMDPPMYAWIGSECVQITGVDTTNNQITVIRGVADPILGGANTTATTHAGQVSGYPATPGHPGDNVTRIIGPTRIVGFRCSTYNNNSLEGIVSLQTDKEIGWDYGNATDAGFIGTVGSGGIEDFFGTGWYANNVDKNTSDNDRYCIWVGGTFMGLARWFANDPVYAAYGVNGKITNGEIQAGTSVSYPIGTTLYVYTSH
jgi:hypothetical protein